MYNGIGLPTPRGSGTSGYIQRNLSYLRPRRTDLQRNSLHDIGGFADSAGGSGHRTPGPRKANAELLEHERKRQIEIQLVYFSDKLIKDGIPAEEVEKSVAVERQRLLALKNAADAQGASSKGSRNTLESCAEGSIKSFETHQMADLKGKELERFRKALKLPDSAEPDATRTCAAPSERKSREDRATVGYFGEGERSLGGTAVVDVSGFSGSEVSRSATCVRNTAETEMHSLDSRLEKRDKENPATETESVESKAQQRSVDLADNCMESPGELREPLTKHEVLERGYARRPESGRRVDRGAHCSSRDYCGSNGGVQQRLQERSRNGACYYNGAIANGSRDMRSMERSGKDREHVRGRDASFRRSKLSEIRSGRSRSREREDQEFAAKGKKDQERIWYSPRGGSTQGHSGGPQRLSNEGVQKRGDVLCQGRDVGSKGASRIGAKREESPERRSSPSWTHNLRDRAYYGAPTAPEYRSTSRGLRKGRLDSGRGSSGNSKARGPQERLRQDKDQVPRQRKDDMERGPVPPSQACREKGKAEALPARSAQKRGERDVRRSRSSSVVRGSSRASGHKASGRNADGRRLVEGSHRRPATFRASPAGSPPTEAGSFHSRRHVGNRSPETDYYGRRGLRLARDSRKCEERYGKRRGSSCNTSRSGSENSGCGEPRSQKPKAPWTGHDSVARREHSPRRRQSSSLKSSMSPETRPAW